jgi:hypothetical protein
VFKNVYMSSTVKLGDKEQFDKEQIGVKEPLPRGQDQFAEMPLGFQIQVAICNVMGINLPPWLE